jgi:inorganic pyrophosphatase
MNKDSSDRIWRLMGLMLKSHPWHGVEIGELSPQVVTSFIEIVPTDTVTYEIDKDTGYLKIDRPQRFSNVCPALYGFLPQTFCGERVAEYSAKKSGILDITGDGDPLDICILSEKAITHGNILIKSIPVGGFRLIDGKEADDKIIAVMKDDMIYGGYRDVSDLPDKTLERLRHYFLTYKEIPGSLSGTKCRITHVYGQEEAFEVIRRSQEDYQNRFGDLKGMLPDLLRNNEER